MFYLVGNRQTDSIPDVSLRKTGRLKWLLRCFSRNVTRKRYGGQEFQLALFPSQDLGFYKILSIFKSIKMI